MSTIAVIGAQWGDEGKGKVVDILSEKANTIVRFQGGNNAGHTVVVDGNKYILHFLPSGILHDQRKCVLGNGMVIDLEGLLNEIAFIERLGKNLDNRLFLSERAHLILPYHKELDAASEAKRGISIGTTLKGIGPAYEDKFGRNGIRIADLRNEETFKHKLKENLREKSILLKYLYQTDVDFNFEKIYSQIMYEFEKVNPYIADTVTMLNRFIDAGENVLFEGAQATLLDIDVGTYPYVTSSNSSSLGIPAGTGVSPKKVQRVFGIAKAYTTRVGSGPFPTELEGKLGELLRARGYEYGSTTGRPRRCGWLDLFSLRFSAMINDFNGISLTKLDVLDDFDEIKICVGYDLDGKFLDHFPATSEELSRVKPVYEVLPGWKTKTTSIRRFEDLPKNARNLVEFVEDYLNVEVVMVSVGAQRHETISRKDIW